MFHLVFPFENPPTPVRVSPSCRAEVHSASEGAPLTAMRCKASCGEPAAVLKSFSRSCLAIWTESAARHGDRLAKKNGELMMYIYHIYHSIYIIYIYVCVAICIYIYHLLGVQDLGDVYGNHGEFAMVQKGTQQL